MYTKKDFGKELKERVQKKQSIAKIAHWADNMYIMWPDLEDAKFLDVLLTLGTMEAGPEFEYSYEELDKIADDLIAGKEVTL